LLKTRFRGSGPWGAEVNNPAQFGQMPPPCISHPLVLHVSTVYADERDRS
jgi:hypothetical protein